MRACICCYCSCFRLALCSLPSYLLWFLLSFLALVPPLPAVPPLLYPSCAAVGTLSDLPPPSASSCRPLSAKQFLPLPFSLQFFLFCSTTKKKKTPLPSPSLTPRTPAVRHLRLCLCVCALGCISSSADTLSFSLLPVSPCRLFFLVFFFISFWDHAD